MKITIGSLIRKELANPDSEMSQAVRKHKAYIRLAKNNPKAYKIALRYISPGFLYFMNYNGKWDQDLSSSSDGCTIGHLLKLA